MYNPFYSPYHANSIWQAKSLYEKFVKDPDERPKYNYDPKHCVNILLCDAAEKGQFSEVQKILKEVNINFKSHASNSKYIKPLHHAALNGHADILELLLKNGDPIDQKTGFQETALILAAYKNQMKCVEVLLNHDASDGLYNHKDRTALSYAIEHENVEMINLLFKERSTMMFVKDELYRAAQARTPVFKLILSGHEEELKYSNTKNETVLHWAAYAGKLNNVKLILKQESTLPKIINKVDDNQCTALMYALKNEHHQIAKLLVQHGAKQSAKHQKGDPVFLAAEKGYLGVIKDFKAHSDTKFDVPNTKGVTPLLIACKNKHPKSAKLLIDLGADVNVCHSREQITPLMYACAHGYKNLVKKLISKDANVFAKDSNDHDVLFYAITNEKFDLAKYLIEDFGKELDLKAKDQQGNSLLYYAVRGGHCEMAKILLDHGVDIDHANRKKQTPLHEAAFLGDLNMLDLLFEYQPNVSLQTNNYKTIFDLAGQSTVSKHTPAEVQKHIRHSKDYKMRAKQLHFSNGIFSRFNHKLNDWGMVTVPSLSSDSKFSPRQIP